MGKKKEAENREPEKKEVEFIAIEKVAELLGVSKKTVSNLVAKGRLPQPKRISSKCLRWVKAEVIEWIAGL